MPWHAYRCLSDDVILADLALYNLRLRTLWHLRQGPSGKDFFKTSNLTYIYLCQLSFSASECSHMLSPISRFQDDELKDLIDAMENYVFRYAIPIHHSMSRLRNYNEAPIIPQNSNKLSRCTQVPSPRPPNAWVSTLLGPRNTCCCYTHPDARHMGSSLFYKSAWRKESDNCQLRDWKTEINLCCQLFQDVYRICRNGQW